MKCSFAQQDRTRAWHACQAGWNLAKKLLHLTTCKICLMRSPVNLNFHEFNHTHTYTHIHTQMIDEKHLQNILKY